MSSTRCDLINTLLLPLAATALLCSLVNLKQGELILLRASAVFYTLVHLHYAICLVRQMCVHFGICCFKLGPRDDQGDESSEDLLENIGNNNNKLE